jgi:hypothetical protein
VSRHPLNRRRCRAGRDSQSRRCMPKIMQGEVGELRITVTNRLHGRAERATLARRSLGGHAM